ncbi:alpha-amylase [Bdellovibrio bacteriovorus]|uniref:Alpha-amylase n=1 Tax=Bdellovibrio bacteriovorus str. Tiberius TaxID=1069642 RepID=K7ZEX0_BDEBC|nr:alpha-amylase family protein [Bdellovibrio bacteriovorus]AFY00912.1 alpha-amylase [Bdellovibrio bacteriovorus str. Tiberius]
MIRSLSLGFTAILLTLASSLSAAAAPRTVFVQLFEWPWNDIARECEVYLGPAGFSAVQVSPPHEHIHWQGNPWWERYQVVSYQLNSRSGTEAEFADMVRRCRQAGVDVYADAVLNHMTGIPGGVGSSGTQFTHYEYPGLYSHQDFHHCGRNGNNDIRDFRDLYELQNCELVDLADLKTESPYVQEKQAEYLNRLLDLGVAGFRIDAAKHIPARDLDQILKRLKRSAYIYSEIIYDPAGPVQYNDYTPFSDVTAYDYPHRLGYAFKDKNTEALQFIASGFPSSLDSIVFVTNHDIERTNDYSVLKYSSPEQHLYRLAQIFMLAWPFGYPQVYSGFDFNSFDQGPPLNDALRTLPILDDQNQCRAPWTCEHRLPEVAAMVDFRNQTDKAFTVSNWYANGRDVISFARPRFGFVAMNFGSQSVTKEFQTNLPPGEYCNIVDTGYRLKSRSCAEGFSVNNSGKVRTTLAPYSSLVLLVKAQARK